MNKLLKQYLIEAKDSPDFKDISKKMNDIIKKARTLKMSDSEFKLVLTMIANLESIILLKYSR